MNNNIDFFDTYDDAAKRLAYIIYINYIKKTKSSENFYLMISGGSTPDRLFEILLEEYYTKIKWDKIHFFWSDERFVPESHEYSNYGRAKKKFFDELCLSEKNIHKINYSENINTSCKLYEKELETVPDIPFVMDMIILGVGADGHTASIFPENKNHFKNTSPVFPVYDSGNPKCDRITVSLDIISKSENIYFFSKYPKKEIFFGNILNNYNLYKDIYPSLMFENSFWIVSKE
ncbi:MAG: 6-phosphogluconolactonase [Thermotogae bacterium]|nr:6-phosphogluconolactonase [Thermotogota bacterium]